MSGACSRVRLIGLVFLLVSLLEPFTLSPTLAGDAPAPDASALEATPGSEDIPAPDPAVEMLPTEPALEPTIPPTTAPTIAPTTEPTMEPTVVPTSEPTVVIEPTATVVPTDVPTQEPTVEPTATASPGPEQSDDASRRSIQSSNAAQIEDTGSVPYEMSLVPDAKVVAPGEDIVFTYTLTNISDHPISHVTLDGRGVSSSWTIREITDNLSCSISDQNDGMLWCDMLPYRQGTELNPEETIRVSFGGPAPKCGEFSITVGVPEYLPSWQISSTVDVQCAPDIGIDISDQAEIGVGERLDYTVTVANSGMAASDAVSFDVTLPGVPAGWELVDTSGIQSCTPAPLSGNSTIYSCTITSIPAHGTATARFFFNDYDPDPATCDTAITASTSLTPGETGSDSTSTTVECPSGHAAFSVEPVDGEAVRGEMVTFTFTVTNPGYTGVDLADIYASGFPSSWTASGLPESPSCSFSGGNLQCGMNSDTIPELFPLQHGESVEIRISGQATECGLMTINGRFESFETLATGGMYFQATLDVVCPPEKPGISITSSADPASGHIGDEVTITYEVENSGNTPLSGVTVTDPLLDKIETCSRDTLATRAEPYTCTAVYTIDVGDIEHGQIVSEATVSAEHGGNEITDAADKLTIDVLAEPEPSITKTAAPDTVDAGEPIGFIITLTNTSNAAATDASFTDPLPDVAGQQWTFDGVKPDECEISETGHLICEDIELPVGTGEFSVRVVSDTATDGTTCGAFTSTATLGEPYSGSADATASVTCKAKLVPSDLVLESGEVEFGDDIRFIRTITNVGSAPAIDTKVAANFFHVETQSGMLITWTASAEPADNGTCTPTTTEEDAWIRCTGVTLDVGESLDIVFSAPTTVAHCDEDKVQLGSWGVVTVICPDVTIAKIANTGASAPGFTITVTNMSDELVSGVAFEDELPAEAHWRISSATTPDACTLDNRQPWILACSGIELAPGAEFSVDVHYWYDEYGGDTCDVSRESTARLTSEGHAGEATASIEIICPELSLSIAPKMSDVVAGEDIEFTLTIRNASDFDVADVSILANIGGSWEIESPGQEGCKPTPEGQTECTGIPVATGKSGEVLVTIPTTTASCGLHEFSAQITHPVESDTVTGSATVFCPEPSLEITRTIAPEIVRMGDEVTVSYEFINTGNVPLYVPGHGTCGSVTLPTAVGDGDDHIHRCAMSHTVTEDEVDEGRFKIDEMTFTITAPNGKTFPYRLEAIGIPVESDDVDIITVIPAADEVIAGDPVSFTITVENTGEAASGYYGMQDWMFAVSDDPAWEIVESDYGGLCAVATEDGFDYLDCFVGPLAPGESRSVTIQRPTSAASCGEIMNTALLYRASGATHASDVVFVDVLCPELSVALSAEPGVDTTVREGDEITYHLTVRNTGPVPVSSVTAESDIAGLVDEDGTIGAIAKVGVVTLESSYVVTADDVAAGKITRSVTVQGDVSTGVMIPEYSDTLTHTVVPQPSISLRIDADLREPDEDYPLGSIDYTLTVTNSGNSTLTDITIVDPLLTSDPVKPGTLGPGETTIYKETYTITQADVDAGVVINEASAGGMPPGGSSGVLDLASVTTDLAQEASLAIVMSADATEAVPGDDLTFSFEVTNTGTVTLRDIVITTSLDDPVWTPADAARTGSLAFAQGATDGIIGELAPGETRSRTLSYTVMESDLARGEIVTSATVTAMEPEGEISTTTEPLVVMVVQPEPTPEPTTPAPSPTPSTPDPGTPAPSPPGVAPAVEPGATPAPSSTPVKDQQAEISGLPTTGSGRATGPVLNLAGLLLAAVLLSAVGLGVRKRKTRAR